MFKNRYLSAIIGLGAAMLALPGSVMAEEEAMEEVVVTGSRIPRAGFDTMLPATQINAEFIELRGFTNAADALNELPSFGVPASSTQGDQSGFSVGQQFVNFFGLGSQRTLTLVNGRRFVSSNAPTLFSDGAPGLQVDLNVIPSSMIERIETVAVGGAPIYGADAIAGTVNVILKDDFEGFEIAYDQGYAMEYDDMDEKSLNVLYGVNWDGGRGNLVLGVEYNEREGLIESDRDHLRKGWQFREPSDSNAVYERVLVQPAYANIVSPGGVVTPSATLLPNFGIGALDGADTYMQFAPDGTLIPYNVGSPTGNPVWSIGGDGLFLPDVTALYTPYDRTIVSSYANYEITDNVEFFAEFLMANTNATELINQSAYQSGFFGEESFALNFSVDHPLLSASARDTLVNDFGLDNFWLQRASIDIGDRRIHQELNLWRAVGGLRGDFMLADRTVSWDLAYIHGESVSDTRQNEPVNTRFFYALDVVDTADGPQCRVVADPDSRPADPAADFGTSLSQGIYEDCVPLNLFGEGQPSAEALDYITAASTTKTTIEQEVISLNANVDLFELPAGALYIAGGVEHREEDAKFDVGGLAALGLGRSAPIEGTRGGYETDEYYAEFYAPILDPSMDLPFLYSASLEGAFRNVDNSLAGDADIWTIGGRFSPLEDVEIRGNVTRSVRAPAITELFLPLSSSFSFADDPCDQRYVDQGPNPETRRANCIADGIDPDTFASNVVNASVQGLTGGNIDLENETADAWTYGVIFRPRWVEGMTLAIDYVEIDIEDAIESFSLTQIMESCYDQASFPNAFCNQFSRLPSGQLPAVNAFTSGYVNAGAREFEGYTLDMEYTTQLADFGFMRNIPGTLDASLFMFFPQEDLTIVKESIDDDRGEPGTSKIQAQLNLRYILENWSVLWQSRYIGKATINNDDTPTSRDVRELDPVWLFNAAFTYTWNERIQFQLNINNVFDEEPEPAAIASGTDSVYDNIGRFLRAGVRVSL